MRSGLTVFALECRRLRRERKKLMGDQAEALGSSVAYVSGIETGNKPIPHGYVERVACWLELKADENKRLQDAANASSKIVKFLSKRRDNLSVPSKSGRQLPLLTPSQIRDLKDLLSTER